MTVCIGALCASRDGRAGGAVVVASDRMVTLGGLTEFEHEVPKVTVVAARAVALIAGDALRGAQLARDLSEMVPAGTISLAQLAGMTAGRYGELRRQQIDSEIFHPRGVTMQAFYQGLQAQWIPHLAATVDQQVMSYDYGVELLLAGLDDHAAHLHSIANPGGIARDHQSIGFHAIGSGALHALQALIGFGHTPARSLYNTLFRVYAAKRRAEVAPGVGRDTDLWMIEPAGITRVDLPTQQALDALYQELQRAASQELSERIRALPLWTAGGDTAQPAGPAAPPTAGTPPPLPESTPPPPGTPEPPTPG